ncbi:MAG: protein translocase subunit SecD [Beijerinckiaceae bacterium]
MLRYSSFKTLAVALLALGALLFAWPNLWTKETRESVRAGIPSFVPSWLVPHLAMPLGLDLQGGVHLLYELDSASVVRQRATQLQAEIRDIFRRVQVPLVAIPLQQSGVSFRMPDATNRGKVLPEIQKLAAPGFNQLLGTSTRPPLEVTEGDGGLVTVTITEAGISERIGDAVARSIEVIRKRVDPDGVTEPNIQRQGFDRVLVQVPGATDAQTVKDRVGSTAELEFRFVAEAGANPNDIEVVRYKEGGEGATITVEKLVIVKGERLTSATASPNTQSGGWQINFGFDVTGAKAFGEATTKGLYRRLAIVLKDKKPGGAEEKTVISAPTVQSPITGGSGQITGQFTAKDANDLAIQLRSGALPVALTPVEERTIGPGLGQDSIDAGKRAAIVAALLVAGFMIASYGLFGIFANIALAIHITMVVAIMSLLGATLTLPGIAGIVLTIGTAVDANVLIYERIREEVRLGRSIISALEAGFNRAMATITDSNITSFIAAVLLYLFGSGPVRGFAVTLIFGIITTVITAVTMTRMMIALWYKWGRPTKLPF